MKYATFAWQWNFGDPPLLDWWILEDDQSWHDAVRGDGHSYGAGPKPLPHDMIQEEGESDDGFKERVFSMVRTY